MDLSICIVTYRARDLLRDCLHSLEAYPPHCTYEIIVVDNHSQDGVGAMLAAEFPQTRFIENPTNLGYTQPMNTAMRAAVGRFVVQLNADTIVKPGTFDVLLGFMEAHPMVGICTPKVLNRNGTLQKQCRRSAARPWDVVTYFSGLSRLFPKSPFFARYLQTFLDEDETHAVEAVSGSCMFIRQAMLQQIGYLDEQFFAYQEDADFCFRAHQGGWQVFYVPQAQIIHFGGEGGSKVEPYRGIYHWHRSYFLYYRKNLARDYFFLLNWIFYGLMALKLVFSIAATFLRRDKFVGTRKP
jgi:GT2 family glycosyltransferase